MNEWIDDKGVCKTAPATQGLLIIESETKQVTMPYDVVWIFSNNFSSLGLTGSVEYLTENLVDMTTTIVIATFSSNPILL